MTSFRMFSAELEGIALRPGDDGYEQARAGVQRAYLHDPSIAVRAAGIDDIRAAVRYAADNGLAVAIQATGHGLTVPTHDGMLIDTSLLTGVRVDPVSRTAWASAGTRWENVIAATAEHGLAPLSGSSPDVGVAGYTLTGGLGLLGRAFGYAADNVRRIELVTANGALRSVSPGDDLFWAVRGGGGNFGVVTGLEFDLFSLTECYGGGLFFDTDRIPDVLHAYRQWTTTLPDRMSTSIGLIPLPDLPVVPQPLRGRHVAHVRVAHVGTVEDGERLVAPLRALGPRLLDTLAALPYTASRSIYQEPTHPRGFYCANAMLREFDASAADAVLDVAGPGSGVFAVVQFNHLGGALSRYPAAPNAVCHRDAAHVLRVVTLTDGPGREAAKQTANAVTLAVARQTIGRSAGFVQGEPSAPEQARDCYEPAVFERLAAIKAVHDPGNLFRCNVNIPPGTARRT